MIQVRTGQKLEFMDRDYIGEPSDAETKSWSAGIEQDFICTYSADH